MLGEDRRICLDILLLAPNPLKVLSLGHSGPNIYTGFVSFYWPHIPHFPRLIFTAPVLCSEDDPLGRFPDVLVCANRPSIYALIHYIPSLGSRLWVTSPLFFSVWSTHSFPVSSAVYSVYGGGLYELFPWLDWSNGRDDSCKLVVISRVTDRNPNFKILMKGRVAWTSLLSMKLC